MIIAGFQKLSLVDFPGYLCSVVFVQGCNFRCSYCQNPSLVGFEKQTDLSEKEVFDFLSGRKAMIEGVVITGGEPTVYDDLPGFIKKLKEQGFRVKLDTNGSNPVQMEGLLSDKCLDYVALDIKTSFPKYSLVTDISAIVGSVSQSIRSIMESPVPYEFRTTCVPGIVEEEDIAAIGEIVKGAERYCLQQFRPYVTLDPHFQDIKPYSKEVLGKFGDILAAFVRE
ncbi:MAG: anaerobic ribonucleoside-triphosphate reductase activating protein, partial [Candidatus Omnitrophica bacterium]|nr:anaerobic ribonucleoside-triphosphate reductase activating protein [Candidatus Omnitrophota bacterium]